MHHRCVPKGTDDDQRAKETDQSWAPASVGGGGASLDARFSEKNIPCEGLLSSSRRPFLHVGVVFSLGWHFFPFWGPSLKLWEAFSAL